MVNHPTCARALTLFVALWGCGSDTTSPIQDTDGALPDAASMDDTGTAIDRASPPSDTETDTSVPPTDAGGSADAEPLVDLGVLRDEGVPEDLPRRPDVIVRPDAPGVPDVPVRPDVPTTSRCGTRGGVPCPTGQFCNFPLRAMCGATDLGGACENIPRMCSRELRPVCGCDGQDYTNPCEAAQRSASVAREGRCMTLDAGVITDLPSPTDTRPSADSRVDAPVTSDVPSGCAAQDAHGMGGCDRVLGYVWDGSMCRALSGCSCTGTACGALYRTMDGCRAEHRMCSTVDDCRARGCDGGRSCEPCRASGGVVYVCLPRGAVC